MKITCFGEVLWDNLPTGKVLGGAPLNVAARVRALGDESYIISRCGNDEDGKVLLGQIRDRNVPCNLIQIDNEQATSLVNVTVDKKGSASYDIVYPCAWDKICITEEAKKHVAESDAFVYGSLSTRDEKSRATLNELLPLAKFKVFDVNLRKPHYDYNRIKEMMMQADLIKMNDCELYELAAAWGSKYAGLEQNIHFLADLTHTKYLCITLGEHGAVFYHEGQIQIHLGYTVKVVDTIGSGDSFLAGFLHQFLRGEKPKNILMFACALGALVAGQRGATQLISKDEIACFANPA